MTDHATRWILSVAFAVAAGYYLRHVIKRWKSRPGWWSTLDNGLHVVMGISMIAMLWSWSSVVPIMVYVTVFTAAMLWFVAEALFIAQPSASGPVVVGHATRHPHDAWYHAMMMGSMVWMAVVMSTVSSSMAVMSSPISPMSSLPFSGSMGTASDDMASMAGMSMSMSGGSTSPDGMASMSMLPLWAKAPCVLLAIVFCAAAIRLIARGLLPVISRRSTTGSSVTAAMIGGLMAAAMAVTFAEMA
jgi:hypothetical protein